MATGSEQQSATEFVDVAGIRTRFRQAGAGPDVLVLHGWGARIETVTPILTALSRTNRVLAVDMPGFGETAEPPRVWGVADYAAWVGALLDAFAIPQAAIVGHSFGGKVAIHVAAHDPQRVSKLLLVDSAGIKPLRTWRYYAKVYSAKTVKHTAPFLGPIGRAMQQRIARRVASSDYAAASATMRPTFVRVVNEHLTDVLPQITAPTLLIWGEHDTATPLSDGQTMERLIPDAALIVFEGGGHYAYLDDPGRFAIIAANFLSGTPAASTAPDPGTGPSAA